MDSKFKIGGHLAATSGLVNVAVNARALDYSCLQLNLSSGEGSSPIDPSDEELEKFLALTYGMRRYVHMPYTMNPCSDDARKRAIGKAIFRRYARTARAIGAKAVIIHPGYKQELTEELALKNAVRFFKDVQTDDSELEILVETDAGSKNGSAIGSLEFCKTLIDLVGRPDVAMCLDTTHLYARGINLWDKEIAQTELLTPYSEYVRLVHLNAPDPGVELGNNLDRHNTTFADFEKRTGLKSDELVIQMMQWDCILERRSLTIQQADAIYIRQVLKNLLFGSEKV